MSLKPEHTVSVGFNDILCLVIIIFTILIVLW